MKLGYDLTIEQTQKLTMTPELIQAIQILQFNTQELDSFVQNELMQNPVLEYEGNDDNKRELEVSKTETLDKKEAEQSDIDLREKVKEADASRGRALRRLHRCLSGARNPPGRALPLCPCLQACGGRAFSAR